MSKWECLNLLSIVIMFIGCCIVEHDWLIGTVVTVFIGGVLAIYSAMKMGIDIQRRYPNGS